MKAMVATSLTFVDDNYKFPDSWTINHVTNNLGNLAITSEYND